MGCSYRCQGAHSGAEAGPGRSEDLSVDLALEAVQDLTLGRPVLRPPLGIGACSKAIAQPSDGDDVQGIVGVAVPSSVEPVPAVFSDDAGIGSTRHKCTKAASEWSQSTFSPAVTRRSLACPVPAPRSSRGRGRSLADE